MTRPAAILEKEIVRAIRAAQKAGLKMVRIEKAGFVIELPLDDTAPLPPEPTYRDEPAPISELRTVDIVRNFLVKKGAPARRMEIDAELTRCLGRNHRGFIDELGCPLPAELVRVSRGLYEWRKPVASW